MQKKDIAIAIQNFVQFYSLKPAIDKLIKKYKVDIFVPINNDKSGIGNLFEETYQFLKKMGYSLKRETNLIFIIKYYLNHIQWIYI